MTQDDVPRGCEMYLPVSDNPSVIETSVDSEQGVCCDAEEKEKMLHACKMSSSGMFELCGISSTVLQLIVALTCSDFTPSFPRIFVQRCLHTVHCVFLIHK